MKKILAILISQITIYLSCIDVAVSQDYILLIGGGPSPEESQSSIELNVIWSEKIIRDSHPDAKIRIFYSDGEDPAPDVVTHLKITDPDAGRLPIDRVFRDKVSIKQYYNHSIKNHSGSTIPEHMVPIVTDDFKNLTEKDSVLILYNGHGGFSAGDISNNYLRLWGEKKLTVYDFESMLSHIKPQIPVRYIMTQCFSGGFANAIHENASNTSLELAGNRCGFMSQIAERESEGCTASLNIGDYRDYSTYFFAALDGKTRQNTPLSDNPDINGDSRVSLREAHFYTLATAYSSDLSRSTSEDYLEKWEPWYLRWVSDKERQKKSIYYDITKELAKNNNIPEELIDTRQGFHELRAYVQQKKVQLEEKDIELLDEIKAIQSKILQKLKGSYPDLVDEYKNNFPGYSEDKISEIRMQIINIKEYSRLTKLFSARADLLKSIIDANRERAQVEKIFRLLRLAKLDGLMPVFSSRATYSNYEKLVACENTDL